MKTLVELILIVPLAIIVYLFGIVACIYEKVTGREI